MSQKRPSSDEAPATARALAAAEVIAWLKAHPSFLAEHPEAARYLNPDGKTDDANIVDLGHILLRKARDEAERLAQECQGLVALSRDNMTAQAQMHSAVLSLLEAKSFEAMLHSVTHEWPALLNIECVAIGIESEMALDSSLPNPHLFLLPLGEVERMMRGRHVRLREERQGDEGLIFRGLGARVQSSALIRLDLGAMAPAGVLAMGSRREGKFHPNQGTDLLEFLGQVLGRMVQVWLGPRA